MSSCHQYSCLLVLVQCFDEYNWRKAKFLPSHWSLISTLVFLFLNERKLDSATCQGKESSLLRVFLPFHPTAAGRVPHHTWHMPIAHMRRTFTGRHVCVAWCSVVVVQVRQTNSFQSSNQTRKSESGKSKPCLNFSGVVIENCKWFEI